MKIEDKGTLTPGQYAAIVGRVIATAFTRRGGAWMSDANHMTHETWAEGFTTTVRGNDPIPYDKFIHYGFMVPEIPSELTKANAEARGMELVQSITANWRRGGFA